MYQIKRVMLSDGERDAILVDSKTGIPHFYANLYSTIYLRNSSKSVNTIIQNLEAIRNLYLSLAVLKINVEERYLNGSTLKINEIDAICDRLGYKRIAFDGAENQCSVFSIPKTKDAHRMIPKAKRKSTSSDTKYIRITYTTLYLKWLATQFSAVKFKDIKVQTEAFEARRPAKKGQNKIHSQEKGLLKEQAEELFDLIGVTNIKSPFPDFGIRTRNFLIVKILHDLGLRAGELLCLRVEDCNYNQEIGSYAISIVRQQDSYFDGRINQPNVKTQERIIEINETLAHLIEEYIRKYRSKFPFAKKHPYLFVTHKEGPYCGRPLSKSSLAKLFSELSHLLKFRVHPHMLRHSWNYNFSKLIDKARKSGKITAQQEEDIRSYMMGWKMGSGTASIYNRRYIVEEANRASLVLQGGNWNDDE